MMHARDPFFIDYVFFSSFSSGASPFNLRKSQLNQCNGFPSHPVTKKTLPSTFSFFLFCKRRRFLPLHSTALQERKLLIRILCTRNTIQIFVLYYYILGSTLNLYLRFLRQSMALSILGNRVLSCSWSNQSTPRVKVSKRS